MESTLVPVPAKKWYTTAEAAVYLCTTPKNLRMMISRAKIKPDALGSRGGFRGHRFARETLDAYLQRHGKA